MKVYYITTGRSGVVAESYEIVDNIVKIKMHTPLVHTYRGITENDRIDIPIWAIDHIKEFDSPEEVEAMFTAGNKIEEKRGKESKQRTKVQENYMKKITESLDSGDEWKGEGE